MQVLIDSGSEVNAVYLFFVKQQGLFIRPTNVGAQKIDSTTLDTHKIVVAAFSIVDKANQVRFFEKTFLLANVSSEVVFRISFLTLSNADVDFSGQDFWWRTYTIEKALPTTRRVELVGKKEFATTALDLEHETYVIYVTSLDDHLSWRPQISGLIAEKAPTKVSTEYSDFTDVFSQDLTSELPKHTRINDHAIELVKSQ